MVGNNLEAEAVAQVPKAKDAEDALFQIGSHKGVHIESETSDAQVAHEHSDFLFQCVGEEEAGFDDAGFLRRWGRIHQLRRSWRVSLFVS